MLKGYAVPKKAKRLWNFIIEWKFILREPDLAVFYGFGMYCLQLVIC